MAVSGMFIDSATKESMHMLGSHWLGGIYCLDGAEDRHHATGAHEHSKTLYSQRQILRVLQHMRLHRDQPHCGVCFTPQQNANGT